MPYNPWIRINILKKALEIAAQDVQGPSTKTIVDGWIKDARNYYAAQAQLKASKTKKRVTT